MNLEVIIKLSQSSQEFMAGWCRCLVVQKDPATLPAISRYFRSMVGNVGKPQADIRCSLAMDDG